MTDGKILFKKTENGRVFVYKSKTPNAQTEIDIMDTSQSFDNASVTSAAKALPIHGNLPV